MAKIADYLDKDDLETEIEEAADDEASRADDLPAKFKGKSVADVARAYAELETVVGRQGQQLNKYRDLIDSSFESRKEPARETAPAKKAVTAEDLYTNADGAIRQVVAEETAASVESLATRVARAEARAQFAEFKAKTPDYDEILQDPKLLDWIKASPYRLRVARAADAGDLDAAEELFGSFRDHKSTQTVVTKKTDRKAAARAASLESASPTGAAKSTDTISRHTIMEKKIAARRGDQAAERWLRSNSEAIAIAYEERRVVD